MIINSHCLLPPGEEPEGWVAPVMAWPVEMINFDFVTLLAIGCVVQVYKPEGTILTYAKKEGS